MSILIRDIPPHDLRSQVQSILVEACQKPSSLVSFNKLKKLEGFKIVEKVRRNTFQINYKCSQFVFSKILKESWAPHYTQNQMDEKFWENPIHFLETKKIISLKESEEIIKGDIICYIARDKVDTTRFEAKHWGIVLSENQVISKFGSGSIFSHPIIGVPDYGKNSIDGAIFFRHKIKNTFLHLEKYLETLNSPSI